MGELGDRYEVLGELGRGGMGRVLVAKHRELGTEVAVKRLAPDRDTEEDVARFRREARLVAALSHPNIVRVFDSGADDEGPYMVMELLQGEDLAAKLKREGALAEAETRRILAQISDALIHAHAAGLVHRDIKPANIFLSRESWSEEPVIKVLDFGIAKLARPTPDSTTVTVDGAQRGSPAYMSPEQVWGQAVDQRTDVWALAVVTYEMLTGKHPFKAEAVGDTLSRICSSNYAPPSRLEPSLSDWDAFFVSGFAVRREERAATVPALMATSPHAAQPTAVAAAPSRQRRAWLLGASVLIAIGTLGALALKLRPEVRPLASAKPEPPAPAAITTPEPSEAPAASPPTASAVALPPPSAPPPRAVSPVRVTKPKATSAAEGRRRDPFTGLAEAP